MNLYKTVIDKNDTGVVLKICETLHLNKDGKFKTSYLVDQDKNFKTVRVSDDVMEVEYYTTHPILRYEEELGYVLTTVLFNCKVIDMVLSDTIKNENGEESNTAKFNDIKSLATYLKALNDTNINYIQNKVGKDYTLNGEY